MPPSQTVGDIGEVGLLRLLRRLARPAAGVELGIGDDAALLGAIGPRAVLSSDLLVERQDFDFRWATPEDVGHKAAAVNLSDLAAMGAAPRALLLSLALRRRDRVSDVMALARSFARCARRYGAPLVGGDLSATGGPLVVSVTAVGQVEADRALTRHTARTGDVILVSGSLGAAAAGLRQLGSRRGRVAAHVRRQLRPTPRLKLGRALAQWGLVRAAADVSDGIATDAGHLCCPGTFAALDPERLPLAAGLRDRYGRAAVSMALSGGEDFELVFAVHRHDVAAAARIASQLRIRLTEIGRIRSGRTDGAAIGFDHFR